LLVGNPDLRDDVRHPGIADLPGPRGGIDAEDLSRTWVARIATALGARVSGQAAPFMRGREDRVSELAARFREEWWTARR